jgi:hypothetical protein
MAIWNILQTFGIFYDHLVHFVFVRYIFSGFGIMYQEKSGNPAPAVFGRPSTFTTDTLTFISCNSTAPG